MLQHAQLVAAPKESNGPEHCNDVVDWNGTQFFDQSLCFRTTCPLQAACLFLTASARPSLCTGVHVIVLCAFVLCFLFTIRWKTPSWCAARCDLLPLFTPGSTVLGLHATPRRNDGKSSSNAVSEPAAPSSGRARDRIAPIHLEAGALGPPCRQPRILSILAQTCILE